MLILNILVENILPLLLHLLILPWALCLAALVRVGLRDADLVTTLLGATGVRAKKEDQDREFAGKIVWVTGASAGIGRALTILLAERGCKQIVISSRRQKLLEETAALAISRSSASLKPEIKIVAFDLAKHDIADLLKNAENCWKQFGRIDYFFNNAGALAIGDSSVEDDHKIFLTTAQAPILLGTWFAEKVAKLTLAGDSSPKTIVTTSSIAAKFHSGTVPSYSASKSCVLSYFNFLDFSKGANNLCVSTVLPGPVDTSMYNDFRESLPEQRKKQYSKQPMTTEICAARMLTAAFYGIKEAWICDQPLLTYVYLFHYFPAFTTAVTRFFNITT